jgi:hypothetical protein
METGFALSQIDTTTPHPGSIYDTLLGGKDNYAADRQAVQRRNRILPGKKACSPSGRQSSSALASR